jgi:threonine aldolase
VSDAVIDLRSDTVTRPSPAMRRAMAEAEVGDDVFGEDPTVERLQEEAAAAMGCEAALFVPSGTMGNQICLRLHAAPGSEVICDAQSHVLNYEMGAMAALSGLLPRAIASADGLPDLDAIERVIAPEVNYRARTGVITVENTHNMTGGRVFRRERIEPVVELARRRRLPTHLDGARIFNAATALGVSAAAVAKGFDSVMFCLSKGLGAPVGSLVCGGKSFVAEARRVRKTFGGGMRQVGVLAAAGLVALRDGPGRLGEDHAQAAKLALALAGLRGIELDPRQVETNIVIFRVLPVWFRGASPEEGTSLGFLAQLREKGVLGVPVSADQVRFVTHLDVGAAAIEQAIAAVRSLAD